MDDLFDEYKSGKFSFNSGNIFLDVLSTSVADDPYSLVECINRINFLGNYDILVNLLKSAYNSEYIDFINTILN